jgi:alpha-tubulin suppressor-like RCC1 family protein
MYVQVVAGEQHACGLTEAGDVYCWGDNGNSQLGDGSDFDSSMPVAVKGLDGAAVELAAGGFQTCALMEDGSALCWPINWDATEPAVLPGLEQNVTVLAGGRWHFCAVVDEEALCWGNNRSGQLGSGDEEEHDEPVPVTGLAGVPVALAAGYSYTCALLDTGTVQCWGGNQYGQLGNGTTENSLTPVDVIGLSGSVIDIAAGANHTCALLESDEVQCWGYNAGLKTNSTEWLMALPEPIAIEGLGEGITEIAAGGRMACALQDGSVVCWALNNVSGELGVTPSLWDQGPVAVDGLDGAAVGVSAGDEFACAVLENGHIQCWGYNQQGQLGNGAPIQRDIPLTVRGVVSPTDMAIGGWSIRGFTCATVAGRLKCWGDNGSYQFGVDSVRQSGLPMDGVRLPSPVVQVTAGTQFVCALQQSGGVQCWGPGFDGQLGNGKTEGSLLPVQVSGLTRGVKQLAGAIGHTCALTEAGKVLCWGTNSDGQLGIGDEPFATTPTAPVGLEEGVVAIYTSDWNTCALLEEGTALCWGENRNGQLGDGTQENRNEPTPVTVIEEPIIDLAMGNSHTCALLEDGVARCWGSIAVEPVDGGVPQSFVTQTVAVEGLPSPIVDIGAAGARTCAILDDGGLWCWGGNTRGELGTGAAAARTIAPAPVIGLGADVTAVYLGLLHACAVLANGEVRCWGDDGDGQLGVGSSPVVRTPARVVEAVTPQVHLDTVRGAPGSRFVLAGEQFARSTPLTVLANGEALSPTLTATGRGALLAWLDTADADPGYYEVTVFAGDAITATDGVSLTLHLLITDTAPLLAPIGGAVPTLAMPAGIARDLADAPAELQQRTYLTIKSGVNVRSAPNGDLLTTTAAMTDVLYDAGRPLDDAVDVTFTDIDGAEVVLQGVSAANRIWLPVLWEEEPAWVADVVVSGVAVR